ncbi:MAG: putative Ig domain-containing protein, partial [Acidobacteriota bacterium]
MEYSTNGGAAWTVMPDANFTAGVFNATISTGFSNPIGGLRAWGGGTIGAMTQVTVNLASLAGNNVMLRWREGDDSSAIGTGWFVDSVTIANAGVASSCVPTGVCPTITINPATLPAGFVGTLYTQALSATGGTGPYTFTLDSGSLPANVLLSGGTISGTPNATGVSNFTIKATDNNGCMQTRSYTVVISGTGLMFYPLATPVRLLDTRSGESGCFTPGAQIPGGTSLTQVARNTCGIPATAKAVVGNITTVNSGGGYLTIYPSDAGQPVVANSNYLPNEVLNNVFTVGLGNADGAFKIYVTTNADVVVDITGYYAPPVAGGLYFHSLPTPIRLLETRVGQTGCSTPGTPLPGNADTTLQGTTTCVG